MYFSHIDQHKRDSFITTYDSDGMVVKQARVRNSPLLIQTHFEQCPAPPLLVTTSFRYYWQEPYARTDVVVVLRTVAADKLDLDRAAAESRELGRSSQA